MIICNNCGVELEDAMINCPLCGNPVNNSGKVNTPVGEKQQAVPSGRRMSQPQKKFTWEIVSLILISGIMATIIIDDIINKGITWSEYPAAIGLIIFFYVSIFAFWNKKTIMQMVAGFIIASLFLVILDWVTSNTRWSIKLGIPLLFAANMVVAILFTITRFSKYKGINLIAWAFLGASLLCICIDGILSFYHKGIIHLEWSIIVAGCIIPVVLVLLFVYFRLKKGRSLEKTFHV